MCQNSLIVELEELVKPKKILDQKSITSIYNDLGGRLEKTPTPSLSLVNYGEHSLIQGYFNAYKEHRPITISPDIVWLLICQGFSNHINANPQLLRNNNSALTPKTTLSIFEKGIVLGDTSSSWEKIFPKFQDAVETDIGKEISSILNLEFTTSTSTSKIAFKIALLETVKTVFDYQVLTITCGIPKVKIEGTLEDWQKIRQKLDELSKFDLEWWCEELKPLLDQIILTKQDKIDHQFWMNIVKKHSKNQYNPNKELDGWIVKFFPYDKFGERNSLLKIDDIEQLPSEIMKVPFQFKDLSTGKEIELEFWAGFIGLSQKNTDFMLKPEISWAVLNNNIQDLASIEGFKTKTIIDLALKKITKIPISIFKYKEIQNLSLDFLDEIYLPNELEEIKIENLKISGQISDFDKLEIVKRFKNSHVEFF